MFRSEEPAQLGCLQSLIPIVLNCIACVGWSVVNSIVGAQTLRAVSDSHQIPTAAAIIVIAIGTIAVSFMGYRVVHLYEQYSWIPVRVLRYARVTVTDVHAHRLQSSSLSTSVRSPALRMRARGVVQVQLRPATFCHSALQSVGHSPRLCRTQLTCLDSRLCPRMDVACGGLHHPHA